jgi:hypothetical protein
LERQLAYRLSIEGVPDAEICKRLKIKPADLAKAKTPHFLKRVELARRGAEILHRPKNVT